MTIIYDYGQFLSYSFCIIIGMNSIIPMIRIKKRRNHSNIKYYHIPYRIARKKENNYSANSYTPEQKFLFFFCNYYLFLG